MWEGQSLNMDLAPFPVAQTGEATQLAIKLLQGNRVWWNASLIPADLGSGEADLCESTPAWST